MAAWVSEELLGKIVVVTGAGSGIGKAACVELARKGADVVMVVRDMIRGNQALEEVRDASSSKKVRMVLCDLSSMKGIREFSRNLSRQLPRIDILINNAAIVPPQRQTTSEGLEMQFAVNYLAGVTLARELFPLLKKSPEGRIINVSSGAHRLGEIDLEDLQWEHRPYRLFKVYATTKLMNLLFTRDLARRYAGTNLSAFVLHPGVIATNIYRMVPGWIRWFLLLFTKKPAKGSETILHLATRPLEELVNGGYYDDRKLKEPDPRVIDDELGSRLMDESEKILIRLLRD